MARKRRRTQADPETAAVQTLIQEATRSSRQRARTADAAARGLRASLQERSGQLGSAYGAVEEAGGRADELASKAFAGLGSSADAIKGIAAGERSSGIRRAAEARARGMEEVGKIGTSIEREKSSRHAQIGQDLQETFRTIAGQASESASEAAKQAAQNALARARIRATRRGQDITKRGQDISKEQKDQDQALARDKAANGGGSGGLTPAQRRAQKRDRNKAEADVRATLESHPAMKLRTARGKKLRSRAVNTLVQRYGFDRKRARKIVHRTAKVAKPRSGDPGFIGPPTPRR